MAMRLVRKGHIEGPLHFNIVLGVNGGAAATPVSYTHLDVYKRQDVHTSKSQKHC